MENKIDVVSTLLRSVLQRTLPAPRPSSIVKISPTTAVTANVQPNSENDEQSARTDVVVRKNVVGKPMKFIINAHGQIAPALSNDVASTESASESLPPTATTTLSSKVSIRPITTSGGETVNVRQPVKNVNNSKTFNGGRKVSMGNSRDDDEQDEDDLSMESGEVPMHNRKSSGVTKKSPPKSKISVVPKRSPNDDHADDEMNDATSKNNPNFVEEVCYGFRQS